MDDWPPRARLWICKFDLKATVGVSLIHISDRFLTYVSLSLGITLPTAQNTVWSAESVDMTVLSWITEVSTLRIWSDLKLKGERVKVWSHVSLAMKRFLTRDWRFDISMCEQSCRRTSPRGRKADVEQGCSLKGVAVPPIVISMRWGEVIGIQ